MSYITGISIRIIVIINIKNNADEDPSCLLDIFPAYIRVIDIIKTKPYKLDEFLSTLNSLKI